MIGKEAFLNGKKRETIAADVEAQELLMVIVSPPVSGESIKAMIGRAARLSGLSFGRAMKIWYRLAARIESGEMDELRRVAAEKIRGNDDLKHKLQRLAEENAFLRERLAQERAQRIGGTRALDF